MTFYDCFEKVSVQFLLIDTKRKGGTLDKSLFILDSDQTAEIFSYLV